MQPQGATASQMAQVLEQVEKVATMSGLVGQQREADFAMVFDVGNGRTQGVYVRPTGTFESNTIITFFSPALTVEKGWFNKGLSRDMAIDLLMRNENMMFARFGLWTAKDKDMVVCSVDALLESLDPEEFSQNAYRVAYAADAYEREHGGADVY